MCVPGPGGTRACGSSRRSATQRLPAPVEFVLAGMPDHQRAGLLALLETLADQGFLRCTPRSREQIMRRVSFIGPAAAAGIDTLVTLTLFLFYGLPDERGRNPSWRTLGYPGPISPAPEVERPLRPRTTHPPDATIASACRARVVRAPQKACRCPSSTRGPTRASHGRARALRNPGGRASCLPACVPTSQRTRLWSGRGGQAVGPRADLADA
jgi:hypothetical protein